MHSGVIHHIENVVQAFIKKVRPTRIKSMKLFKVNCIYAPCIIIAHTAQVCIHIFCSLKSLRKISIHR